LRTVDCTSSPRETSVAITERLHSEVFQLGDYWRDPIVGLLRDDDIGAGERQAAGDSATHALPGTGYDRDTIAEFLRLRYFVRFFSHHRTSACMH
jgi:hypothetical protein